MPVVTTLRMLRRTSRPLHQVQGQCSVKAWPKLLEDASGVMGSVIDWSASEMILTCLLTLACPVLGIHWCEREF